MAIKWQPPSEEELAARGVGAALETERPRPPADPDVNEARAKKPSRKREG